MKTRMFILAALAAPLLAWGAPISDIGDLIANPDDVMLRKPAKKAAAPKPAIWTAASVPERRPSS